MRGKLFVLVLAALMAPASAAAMSGEQPHRHCRVLAGDKLPTATGGADALCAAIEDAIAARAPHAHYSAEVKVVSSSRLVAALAVNGRALPEQQFAVMDRELGKSSIERFANSLAAEVAKAAKP